jgi:hypothetical protein
MQDVDDDITIGTVVQRWNLNQKEKGNNKDCGIWKAE